MPNDRILVVDNEQTIREVVSSMLSGADFQTCQATSGTEALALLESGDEFDLVLSALMMPEMDGIALLERIKDKYPNMPVVIVTAVNDIQVALQALRNGAYHYLLKPFERSSGYGSSSVGESRLKREIGDYRINLESLVAALPSNGRWHYPI